MNFTTINQVINEAKEQDKDVTIRVENDLNGIEIVVGFAYITQCDYVTVENEAGIAKNIHVDHIATIRIFEV